MIKWGTVKIDTGILQLIIRCCFTVLQMITIYGDEGGPK